MNCTPDVALERVVEEPGRDTIERWEVGAGEVTGEMCSRSWVVGLGVLARGDSARVEEGPVVTRRQVFLDRGHQTIFPILQRQ